MKKDFNHRSSFSEKKRNETVIKRMVDRLIDAWNSHDAKVFASFLTEDGEWTDVIGQTTIGRKEVENIHVYPFTTVLKEAVLTVKSQRIRWVKDNDIASVDIIWESTGHKTPDGQPIASVRHGLLNLLVKKEVSKRKRKNEIWKIVLGHNTDYTSTYTQSDAQKNNKPKEDMIDKINV